MRSIIGRRGLCAALVSLLAMLTASSINSRLIRKPLNVWPSMSAARVFACSGDSASLMNPLTCAPLNRLLRMSVLSGDRGFTYLMTGTAGGARQVRRPLE